MAKKLTTEEFIKKAQKIHKDKYDYSDIVYINNHTKVKIFCKSCNEFFYQIPNNHLNGSGCERCSYEARRLAKIHSLKQFIEKAHKIHNDKYDYSKSIYISAKTYIKIGCNKCGHTFKQLPNNHLRGMGCPYCFGNAREEKEGFIIKAKEVHKDNYSYNKVIYINNRTKVEIYCKKCKKYFWQLPSNHLIGQGCPYCAISKGEEYIKEILSETGINYLQQYKFKDCKDKVSLPFDFYLPDYNICIEYQGKQHYREGFDFYISFNKGNLEKARLQYEIQKKHDKIKKEYCKKNKILLIEVKYNTKDIKTFLYKHLRF